jgi:hypothetical protein
LQAVLIRPQAGLHAACPDLNAWFQDYHGRPTIEAGVVFLFCC